MALLDRGAALRLEAMPAADRAGAAAEARTGAGRPAVAAAVMPGMLVDPEDHLLQKMVLAGPTWGDPMALTQRAEARRAFDLMMKGSAGSTIVKYERWVEVFATFCRKRDGSVVDPVPTTPLSVMLWIQDLLDQDYAPTTIDGAMAASQPNRENGTILRLRNIGALWRNIFITLPYYDVI